MKSKYLWGDMLTQGKVGEGKDLSPSDFVHDIQQDAIAPLVEALWSGIKATQAYPGHPMTASEVIFREALRGVGAKWPV